VVMSPASVSKVANLEHDLFSSERTTLVHVLGRHLSFLSLLSFLLSSHLLVLKVGRDLRIEISLHG